MTDITTSVITPSAEQTKALEMFSKALALLGASFGLKVDALPTKGKRGGRKSKAAAASSEDSEPKPKRVLGDKIAALNEERIAVFAEMRQAWLARFPQFSEQAAKAWADNASAADKKALLDAVKASGGERCPTYPEALKEHSKRRAASDPEAAAKYAAYRAKVEADQAEKRSTSSKSDDASVASKPSDAAPSEKPKAKRGPKPKSAEEKAAAKAARDAKKAAEKAAPKAPEPTVSAPPAPAPSVTVVTADADDEEAFKTWSHKGTDYFKNGLNYVYKKTSKGGFGDYVGQYDPVKRVIDTTVPEPEVEDE